MIELKQVSISYGDKAVLHNFDFAPAAGRVTCLLGPSGSGKTTLLHVAGGILKPLRGQVSGLRGQRASYIFQEDRLLPWFTALQNITIHQVTTERALKYLELVGLQKESASLPDELSGGMRRRLAIARALAYGGDHYFLDEPLRGLDPVTADQIIALLQDELRGKSVLLITHSIEEALALGQDIFVVVGPPLRISQSYPVTAVNSPEKIRQWLRQNDPGEDEV